MKKKTTLKISILITIVGLLLITFGVIMISILNDDVNFGSAGNNDTTSDVTPTPTQTPTMDVEENPSVSPTPTPIETEKPNDIVLPSGDSNNSDSSILPTTPPDQGPDGSTTGVYVPPAEEWKDESIPQKQYQLELTNEVSESEFGRLNDSQSLGVNFFFRDHTLYSIVKNGSTSTISYQYFRILGSVGTTNVFMCSWDQSGQFNSNETRIYKCQIDNSIDTSSIAVSIVYD